MPSEVSGLITLCTHKDTNTSMLTKTKPHDLLPHSISLPHKKHEKEEHFALVPQVTVKNNPVSNAD